MAKTLGLYQYIIFNAQCAEAMKFYHTCFGGNIEMNYFKDIPGDVPPGAGDLVMHANIKNNHFVLMASDATPDIIMKPGDNVSLSVDATSQEEADKFFNHLAQGGSIKMPIQKTFWGAYFGMLVDKFGLHWMINYDFEE